MSATTSTTVRFEDHFGPTVPDLATSPHATTPVKAHHVEATDRLRSLVEQMRASVAAAAETGDLSTKVELWEAYRHARARAIALLSAAHTV